MCLWGGRTKGGTLVVRGLCPRFVVHGGPNEYRFVCFFDGLSLLDVHVYVSRFTMYIWLNRCTHGCTFYKCVSTRTPLGTMAQLYLVVRGVPCLSSMGCVFRPL